MRTVGWTRQTLISIRNQDADCDSSKNVEEEDTPEDPTNSLGNVPTGILSFACGHSDHLDTAVSEGSIDQNVEEG